MSKSIKTIEKIFILLIIFASFTGLMSYIDGLTGQGSLRWAYGVYSSDGGIGGVVLRYGRDVLVIVLLLKLVLNKKCLCSNTMVYVSAIFIYSILVGMLNQLNYRFYICGIREFIYAIVVIFIFILREKNKMITESVYKILPVLVIFQVIAQGILIVKYHSRINIGVTRLPGLCNSAIALGYFSTGMAVACAVLFQYFRKYSLWQCVAIIGGCTFLSITAGTRVAMICNFILLITVIAINSNKNSNIRWLLIIMGVLVAVPILIKYSVSLAGRGELMESGHMRVEFFGIFFKYTDLFQKIFGCGLGALTNNAANMQLQFSISKYFAVVDSTWGIILGQFGIAGVIGLLFLILYTIKRIISNKIFRLDNILNFAVIAVGFITMSGTNIFEQSVFGMLYIWSLCCIVYFRETHY